VTPASERRLTSPKGSRTAEGFSGSAAQQARTDRGGVRSLQQANSWSRRRASTLPPNGCRLAYATCLIRKSSIRLPDLSFATSQRGVFPRPAQVSDGRSGFRNFGTTVGYGRRPVDDFVLDDFARTASMPPLSCFRRSSSRRFSASSVVASLAATSSWSAHSSSVDIDLKSFRFTTVPNHDSTWLSSMVSKHEQK
jgi:hypothetical protein